MKTIRDGADARAFLNGVSDDSTPELILMDLNLPRVDGTALIDLLRSRPELQ
ncbi:MAG: hypothetical protein JWP63_1776, partial [Candidatus Solibacter sp.]|nr:hypothetical protein [Candidatus Solibacter sp.]